MSRDIGAFFVNHSISLVVWAFLSDAYVEHLRLFDSHHRIGATHQVFVCRHVAPSLLLGIEHLGVSVRGIDNSLYGVEI